MAEPRRLPVVTGRRISAGRRLCRTRPTTFFTRSSDGASRRGGQPPAPQTVRGAREYEPLIHGATNTQANPYRTLNVIGAAHVENCCGSDNRMSWQCLVWWHQGPGAGDPRQNGGGRAASVSFECQLHAEHRRRAVHFTTCQGRNARAPAISPARPVVTSIQEQTVKSSHTIEETHLCRRHRRRCRWILCGRIPRRAHRRRSV